MILFLVCAPSCTHPRARVPQLQDIPSQIGTITILDPKEMPPEADFLGVVRADVKGSIFASCDAMAQRAVDEILDGARAKSATKVYALTWNPQDPQAASQRARCRVRWGFFLFPVLVFYDIFMSATVEAKIYK